MGLSELFDFGGPDTATPAFNPAQAYADARRSAITQALLSGGFGLLNAGGPSPYPVSTGQAIARGGMAGLGALNAGNANAYRSAMTTAQLGEFQRRQRKQDELDRLQRDMMLEMGGAPPSALPGQGPILGNMDGAGEIHPNLVSSSDPAHPINLRGSSIYYPPGADANTDRLRGLLQTPEAQAVIGAGKEAQPSDGYVRGGLLTVGAQDAPTGPRGLLDMNSALPASAPRTTMSPMSSVSGVPPAMMRYIMASNPAAAAQLMRRESTPVAVGANGLYIPGVGIVGADAPKPQIREFHEGDQLITKQSFDGGRTWQPVEGGTAPRWNPVERGGAPTLAQQASNAEIDQARNLLAGRGLTRDAILKATQRQTDTGRDNPDFDPQIARLVGLATQRKIGANDDGFESAWSSFLGGPGQGQNDGAVGLQPGFLTEDALGPERNRVLGVGPGTLGGPVDLPKNTAGKTDAMQLKNGQVYRLGDGSLGRWDAAKRNFIVE